MKFRDMSTEMTEQEIITALYMICPDSLYKRYKREKGLDRISATALSRLCAIPAYADFFKPSYKEIIAEAMKSDAQKTYERNSQPVIEEKNRAIGKTYMSNFLLRKALSMANTAVSSDEVASNE